MAVTATGPGSFFTSKATRFVRVSAKTLLFMVAVVGWFAFLRPQNLGGPLAYVVVKGNSMQPALRAGDLVMAKKADSYNWGDVVVFRVSSGAEGSRATVIHRVNGGNGRVGYFTQGDNRNETDPWRPKDQDVVGKMVMTIPRAGNVLILLTNPWMAAALGGFIAFVIVYTWEAGTGVVRRKARSEDPELLPVEAEFTPVPTMVEEAIPMPTVVKEAVPRARRKIKKLASPKPAVEAPADIELPAPETVVLGHFIENPQPNEEITVTGEGFAAGAKVIISLDAPALILGTGKANRSGMFKSTVSLPRTIPEGENLLIIAGHASQN
jgi:signal peptidase I